MITSEYVLSFGLACFAAFFQTVSSNQSNDLLHRFQAEAPAGWARLSRDRFEYSFSYAWRSAYPQAKIDNKSSSPVRVKIGPKCRMVWSIGPDGTERVAATNPNYRFAIERRKGSSDWKIAQVEPSPTPMFFYDLPKYIGSGIEGGTTVKEPLEKSDAILQQLAHSAKILDICGESISVFSPAAIQDVTKCTDFRAVSARVENIGGRELVAVEISWRLGKLPLQATIWCDPKCDWEVVKWHRPVSIMNMGA